MSLLVRRERKKKPYRTTANEVRDSAADTPVEFLHLFIQFYSRRTDGGGGDYDRKRHNSTDNYYYYSLFLSLLQIIL